MAATGAGATPHRDRTRRTADSSAFRPLISDATSDDSAKNLLRARVEGRFGLDVYQPAGIVKATLAAG